MNFKKELRDLSSHFFLWLLLFFIGIIVVGFVKFSFVSFHNFIIPGGDPNGLSLVARSFLLIKSSLLPSGVELIATTPIAAFLIQLKISILLSFTVTFPYLLYCLIRYFSPALFPNEKLSLVIISVSSSFLFIGGMFFAYRFLVLSMFNLLFSFNKDLQVASFLSVDEFVSWTLATLAITGLLFLLPVFMYLLSIFHIIGSSFWKRRWREVFLVFLVGSSILTPDVSGFSVLALSIPMILLYFVGILLTISHERKRARLLKTSK